MERTTGYPWTLFRTLHQGLLFFSFFPFLFIFDCITQHEGILAPQPVIKPVPSALGVWSLDCYTTREVPRSVFFFFFFHFFALDPKLGPWWWLSSFFLLTVEEALVEDAWTSGKSGRGYCLHFTAYWHTSYEHQKKIELILIIILAAPLDSMIKFKIYFSRFQEN